MSTFELDDKVQLKTDPSLEGKVYAIASPSGDLHIEWRKRFFSRMSWHKPDELKHASLVSHVHAKKAGR